MVDKKLSGAGLRGQSAGDTALCTVGKSGSGLTYCGYDVADLSENATFEEVAYLLFNGELPTQDQLDTYKSVLTTQRDLPQALKEVLQRIPADAHPMDVMRTGCSFLGNLEPEADFAEQHKAANRLLAAFPAIMCYWYRFSHEGVEIDCVTDEETIGGHFLKLLNGKTPSEQHRKVMDVSLILYAEHEFNASTFTARVCASTLSDMFSCITGAIGTLRGPLHGGANEAAMDMIQKFTSPSDAKAQMAGMLERKEKIMGFGHAIYRTSDPRNVIIKAWSEKLAQENGDTSLYDISVACEEFMWDTKKLFCNADFFHASAYHFMGIPTKLFTPIFVCSRLTGWAAHVMEQRSNNRIIRPSADYIGSEPRTVTPISER
ncbi:MULTISPECIES: 2-methylcitrate synthase [unclassified Shewanella]|uniref:bifunctional 2-methylcitrate synthase/citrate synthase n=1 Tax=unclassified Shewanella TaxID=196818 RepID=UPI000C817F12|nr:MULTISPECIES: 2-methylcitrate synthase [unclassified Shewanella]MDO6621013.1 2-methylcitrate synthase [Shewanella sp. 6_MG-2023]MDO6639246.1 2-methylcitrate synthase [Shewanella sp. 5_MG-2023]MDO6677498.1 2-methylcitrate synthase [Shewanella sp. 4_MG-2023]MDO6774922.1 2-methylcitrate synthase [Shewanella sp. 3_MG-2023]PMG29406.1 2-methylcitrate synthase [Shewanella sp. 10N.286.52.C2]